MNEAAPARRPAPLLLVLVLSAAGALALGGSHRADARAGCPERFPLGGDKAELKVHDVTCKTARKIVLIFYERSQGEGPHITIRGFRCDGKNGGNGWPVVKCQDGNRRLRYQGGFYKAEMKRRAIDCGTVTFKPDPYGSGGIVSAKNVACRRARKVAVKCGRDGIEAKGWHARGGPGEFRLKKGARRVHVFVAGGGPPGIPGCF